MQAFTLVYAGVHCGVRTGVPRCGSELWTIACHVWNTSSTLNICQTCVRWNITWLHMHSTHDVMVWTDFIGWDKKINSGVMLWFGYWNNQRLKYSWWELKGLCFAARAPSIDCCVPDLTLALTLKQCNSDVKTRFLALTLTFDLQPWPAIPT